MADTKRVPPQHPLAEVFGFPTNNYSPEAQRHRRTNARSEPLPIAGAKRKLLAVGSSARFGDGCLFNDYGTPGCQPHALERLARPPSSPFSGLLDATVL